MLLWFSKSGRHARIGGKSTWDEAQRPRFAEFAGSWPIVRVTFAAQLRRSRLQTAMQMRARSWHAHVPVDLGIPDRFAIDAFASQRCLKLDGDGYLFDFTGMAPPPGDDIERRLLVLLDSIEDFRRNHSQLLDKLGIEIEVRIRESVESA